MDRMGDCLPNNDKEKQAKQDRDYIDTCIAKDEKAHLQDIDTKL